MNKMSFKLFIILFLVSYLSPVCAEFESSIEFRSAAFFHSSERFREIYDDVGASYQLEASTELWRCLDAWANVDWFSKHGKSDGFKDPTKVEIANFSFGIKYPYQFCSQLVGYLGIGPSLGRIWLKDKYRCHCRRSVSKFIAGGVLKSSVYYFFNRCLFVDVFLDYLYQPVHFHRNVDIGGVKIGLGIGAQF